MSEQLRGGSVEDDLPGGQHVAAVGDGQGHRRVLFHPEDGPAGGMDFSRLLKGALQPAWQSLVEVYSRQSGEQTYIYTKEAGERFKVLVVTTGRRDGTVVQVELAPQKLAILLKDPETMGKTLTDEATSDAEPK